jgi:hypothetical protein
MFQSAVGPSTSRRISGEMFAAGPTGIIWLSGMPSGFAAPRSDLPEQPA